MTTYQKYLEQLQQQGVTDKNKLEQAFNTGMNQLGDSSQSIAFKNAYQTYTQGLTNNQPSTSNNNVSAISSAPIKNTTGQTSTPNLENQPMVTGNGGNENAYQTYIDNISNNKNLNNQPTGGLENQPMVTGGTSKYEPVSSLQDWINRGKSPTELVDYVGGKYGVNTEYDSTSNTISGYNQDGQEVMKWTFDKGGYPVREDVVPTYTKETFLSDYQNLVNSGADRGQIENFLQNNKELTTNNRDTVKTIYKDYIKNQNTLKTVNELSSLDGKGLYNQYLKGTFVKGDDVWNSLSPETQALFNQAFTENNKTNYSNLDAKIVPDLGSDDVNEVFNAISQKNVNYQKLYQETVLDNEERKGLRADMSNYNEQIISKRRELQNLRDKLEKENPNASPSYIQALLNKYSDGLESEIDDLVDEYNVTYQEYSLLDSDLNASYEASVKDSELDYTNYQTAVQNKLTQIQTGEATATQKEILELNQAHDLKMQEIQEAYSWKVKQFDQENQDKKGTYMTNSKGQLIYTVGDTSTVVMDGLGNSVYTETQDNYNEQVVENDAGGYTVVRTYKDGRLPEISTYNAYGQLVSGVTSSVSEALAGIKESRQCGQAVNDYLENLGLDRVMGDSYESKVENINSSSPAIGGIAIWNPNKADSKYYEYGHTGIITNISQDGETLEITSWNMNGDKKKTVDTVSREEIESTGGYYNPTFPDTTTETSTIDAEAQNWINLWNNGTMDLTTIFTKIGSSDDGLKLKNTIAKYVANQGGVAYRSKDDPAVQSIQDLQDTVTDLLSDDNKGILNDVSGKVQFYWGGAFSTKKQDFLGKIKYLLDNNTLQNLIDAKQQGATFGALSNEELKMLQTSANILSSYAQTDEDNNITGFNMSENALREELEKLSTIYSQKITRMIGPVDTDPMGALGGDIDEYKNGDDPLNNY